MRAATSSFLDGNSTLSERPRDPRHGAFGQVVRQARLISPKPPLTIPRADYLPRAPLFAPHQFNDILLSDLGIVAWLAALTYSTYAFGFLTVFRVYLAPWFWGCHWLVLITYLQHTDPELPHWEVSTPHSDSPLQHVDPSPSRAIGFCVHLPPRRSLHF